MITFIDFKCFMTSIYFCVPTVVNGHKRLLGEKVVGGQIETVQKDIGQSGSYDEGVSRRGFPYRVPI